MTVHCSHCGEPLMGSVNRCWRCGRSIVVVAGEPELPPIRRKPVELEAVPTAGLVDEASAGEVGFSARTESSTSLEDGPKPSPHAGPADSSPKSDARDTAETGPTPVAPALRSPLRPKYPKKVFAESCAITSVVVGVLTAFTAIMTAWSLIPALVGIVLGAVGLGSDRRKTATIGIVLCCLVVLVSTGRISIWAYRVHERRQLEMIGEF